MKILIWKGYVDIAVYCAETVNQLREIADNISDIVSSYDKEYSDAATKLMADIDAVPKGNNQYVSVKRIINDFISEWCQNGDDSFEQIYFSKVEY